MKARIVLFILTLSFTVSAQTPLQQMVQTEQAFSRMAAEQNTRDAFLAFIADDGVLFRPTAVNGKQWLHEHPGLVPPDKHPLLAWQPAFAGMAAAGDLGFTTGPWEFKTDVKNNKISAYGHFVTLWKKQPNGTWKFVIDLGISHPMSGGPQTLWQPPEGKAPAKIKSVDVASARQKLLAFDRSYSESSRKDLVKAFSSYASHGVRLYRDGNLPFIGRTAATGALQSAKGQVTWTIIGGDVSRSGDLGYTYGAYQVTDATKVTEQGSYVRIWQNEHGQWRIVLDVANPQQ